MSYKTVSPICCSIIPLHVLCETITYVTLDNEVCHLLLLILNAHTQRPTCITVRRRFDIPFRPRNSGEVARTRSAAESERLPQVRCCCNSYSISIQSCVCPLSKRFIGPCLISSIVPVVFLVVQYSPFNLDGGFPMISSNAVPSCMGLLSLFSGLGLDV